MSQSGAIVSEECITAWNDLKLSKRYRYIIFYLSNDVKEIQVETTGAPNSDWEEFRENLINAKTKIGVKEGDEQPKGPRYAAYDFEYSLASGEGDRSKLTFIAWSPDDAGVKAKMVYASSKEALKRALNGFAVEIQANGDDDIEFDSVLNKVSKGMAG